jgi:hypothetical protein
MAEGNRLYNALAKAEFDGARRLGPPRAVLLSDGEGLGSQAELDFPKGTRTGRHRGIDSDPH